MYNLQHIHNHFHYNHYNHIAFNYIIASVLFLIMKQVFVESDYSVNEGMK